MKVFWTEQAYVSLEEIFDFIAVHAPETADRFLKRVLHQAESLGQFPKRGRRVPEFPNTNLRELIIGNYRMIYRAHNETIEIVTVFEGHFQQSLKDILPHESD